MSNGAKTKKRRKSASNDTGAGWFGPSDKAKAVYAELVARWGVILSWGIKIKVHEAHGFIESWEAFSKAWNAGDQDVTALAAQIADLNAAEGYARDHGAPFPKRPPVQGVDTMEARADLSALTAVDATAKAGEQFAHEAAQAAKKAIVAEASAVPWWVWVALFGAAAGGAYVLKPRITV